MKSVRGGEFAHERPPLCTFYRRYRVCGMGPPSSGATTVQGALGMLERFDLTALGKDSPAAWQANKETAASEAKKGLNALGLSGPGARSRRWAPERRAPGHLLHVVLWMKIVGLDERQ